jgi:hypothetical protein
VNGILEINIKPDMVMLDLLNKDGLVSSFY